MADGWSESTEDYIKIKGLTPFIYGLDPNRADHNDDPDGDGYTNLEEFLNGTDPKKKNIDQ